MTTRRGVADTYNVTGISSGLLIAAAPVEVTTAVIEIFPVQVPAGRPAGFTEITSEASVDPVGAVPAVPFNCSHGEPVQELSVGVAVKLSGTPVLLVIFNNCAEGTACPIWNGKDSAVRLVEIRGSFDTLRVTGMTCVPLPAGELATVTVPVYVPGPRPAGVTEMLSGAAVVPVAGADSQLPPVAVATAAV